MGLLCSTYQLNFTTRFFLYLVQMDMRKIVFSLAAALESEKQMAQMTRFYMMAQHLDACVLNR